MKRFLIGQLACFGDCLYATTVAKQIKNDYPGSHVTWAVASKYKSILDLNPHVDKVWDIPVSHNNYYDEVWCDFVEEAIKRKRAGEFDELVFTQIPNSNWHRYDGTIRSSILKGYSKPITVNVQPVVQLSDGEINHVKVFVKENSLRNFKEVILFECAPGSDQSTVTTELALSIAKKITTYHKDVCFLLSSNRSFNLGDPQIIDASRLTFRENVELTHYCTLLIGCSSGITWLSTAENAKPLQMIQVLDRNYMAFAGVQYDFEYWGLPVNDVIEITNADETYVINCIESVLNTGFANARRAYNEVYIPTYYNFRCVLRKLLWQNMELKVPLMIKNYKRRNRHLNLNKLIYFTCIELIGKTKINIAKNAKRLRAKFS